jgi:1-acyl-sn-glycerol-3-phosphate acyltransferase
MGPATAVKLVYMILILVAFILACTPLYPIFLASPQRYRRINARVVSWFSRLYLKILGFRVRIEGHAPARPRGILFTSNHLSYLDVLVIAGRFPGCFITSVEIRQTPILGQITALAGCLFVERRSRSFLGREAGSIATALASGLNVILFPEGTSTSGDTVQRFRQPLFQAGIDAGADLLPVCLSYTAIDGRPLNAGNRDRIFWYGDMTFFDHFLGLASLRRACVTLFLEERLPASCFKTPSDLALSAHCRVVARYLAEKDRTAGSR